LSDCVNVAVLSVLTKILPLHAYIHTYITSTHNTTQHLSPEFASTNAHV